MDNKSGIELIILLLGMVSTISGIVLQWRNRKLTKSKTETEISLDKATEAKIVRDASLSVETNLRVEIDRLSTELADERGRSNAWRDRLLLLEDFFFTKHMPWDHRMTMVARNHNWEIDDPPSVMEYIRKFDVRPDDKDKD